MPRTQPTSYPSIGFYLTGGTPPDVDLAIAFDPVYLHVGYVAGVPITGYKASETGYEPNRVFKNIERDGVQVYEQLVARSAETDVSFDGAEVIKLVVCVDLGRYAVQRRGGARSMQFISMRVTFPSICIQPPDEVVRQQSLVGGLLGYRSEITTQARVEIGSPSSFGLYA